MLPSRPKLLVAVTAVILCAGTIAGTIFAAEIPRSATPEEQKVLNFFRIPSEQTTDATIEGLMGGCEFNPFAVLESRFKGAGGITPQVGGSGGYDRGLNPALACRVARLLIFAEERGCKFKIVSGYRATQGCGAPRAGCAAQGSSCHQYGLAADIGSDRRCINWMLNDVLGVKRPHPTFGVHIAYFVGDYSHVHIQCNENRPAVCGRQTQSCDGRLAFSGDTSHIPNPGPPSSGLTNAFRNAINPQQPTAPAQTSPLQTASPAAQNQPPLNGQNTTPSQPGTCAPQYYCSTNNLYYRASTCVDQLYQTCLNGCSGVSCNVAPQLVSGILERSLSTSTESSIPIDTATKQSTGTRSAFDQISLLLDPTAAPVGVAATTTFILAVDAEDAVRLQEDRDARVTIQLPVSDRPTFTPNQQTFISADLKESAYADQLRETTVLQRTLEKMKETLLRILAYLRPFGRPMGEDNHEYLPSE